MASMVALTPNIFVKKLSGSVADKERPGHPKSLKGTFHLPRTLQIFGETASGLWLSTVVWNPVRSAADAKT